MVRPYSTSPVNNDNMQWCLHCRISHKPSLQFRWQAISWAHRNPIAMIYHHDQSCADTLRNKSAGHIGSNSRYTFSSSFFINIYSKFKFWLIWQSKHICHIRIGWIKKRSYFNIHRFKSKSNLPPLASISESEGKKGLFTFHSTLNAAWKVNKYIFVVTNQ